MLAVLSLTACNGQDIATESEENTSSIDEGEKKLIDTTEENSRQMPEDFEFVNTWKLKKYDSKNELFMWAGISEDDYDEYAVKISLSQEDKEKIWELIRDLNLESYPQEYNENIEDIIPPIGADLKVSYDGKSYEIDVYHVTNSKSHSPKRRKLYDSMMEIIAIVESYPQADEIGEDYPYPIE